MSRPVIALICACLFAATNCSQGGTSPNLLPFSVTSLGDFAEPWAMVFLPDGALLITEKAGKLLLYKDGNTELVRGVPEVADRGQGGLGDVILHPDFAAN